jgi:nicotinate phosphoribosyltransferase
MTVAHTDLDEIRMAAGYLRRGMTEPATFSLFVRELPRDRGFLVGAGLADCLEFLENFRFGDAELAYLLDTVGLPESDADVLAGLRFQGDVWAVPEGRLVFAQEPLLEVTASLPQAQLVETALLNLLTAQTAAATKAARYRIAAGGTDLVDLAARRTQGGDAAFTVARACALVGFAGTSSAAAARRFGLRPVGTMAHSYLEAFGDEHKALRAFAEDFPETMVFLVDTSGTRAGVRAAVEVARALGLAGDRIGVRLDSGDLLGLSEETRAMLDLAGLTQASIMTGGGLDEHELARLAAAAAPFDAYGVGSTTDAPDLDSTYELVEYAGRPVAHPAPGKVTLPGAKQVYRRASGERDLLTLRDEPTPPGHRPLLAAVMRTGRRVRGEYRLDHARERFERDLRWLSTGARRLRAPEPVEVGRSSRLVELIGLSAARRVRR